MRLMGNCRLSELAEREDDLKAAVKALHAELRAAEWDSPEDVLRSFPAAQVHGNRFVVPLNHQFCVVLAVNFASNSVLTELAGDRRQLQHRHAAISEIRI